MPGSSACTASAADTARAVPSSARTSDPLTSVQCTRRPAVTNAIVHLGSTVACPPGSTRILPPANRPPAPLGAGREELPRLLQELGTQALVIEVHDERVDDGTCDSRREHRRLNPRPGVGGTAAHQQAVQTLHHIPEGLMFLEEAQHDRVPLEDARHAA